MNKHVPSIAATAVIGGAVMIAGLYSGRHSDAVLNRQQLWQQNHKLYGIDVNQTIFPEDVREVNHADYLRMVWDGNEYVIERPANDLSKL